MQEEILNANISTIILKAWWMGLFVKGDSIPLVCRHKTCGYMGRSVAPGTYVDDERVPCKMEIYPAANPEHIADPTTEQVFALLKLEIIVGHDIGSAMAGEILSRHYMYDFVNEDFMSGPWRPFPSAKDVQGMKRMSKKLKKLDPKLSSNYQDLKEAIGRRL